MSDRILSASSRVDVEEMARNVENLCTDLRPGFAAFLALEGLMVPQWWVRAIFWIMRRRKDGMGRMFLLFQRLPDLADEFVDAAANHIRNGKDREDLSSVGGFSQREMNMTAAFLAGYRSGSEVKP